MTASTMRGMSRFTGRSLGGDAHLRQSVADILATPLGSRVMRRDYGSILHELVDQPDNARTRMRLFAATAVALLRWEQRLRLTRIAIALLAPGSLEMTLEGERTDTGTVDVITRLILPIRPGIAPAFA